LYQHAKLGAQNTFWTDLEQGLLG